MFERQLDGFDLRCDVVLRQDGTYHIVVISGQPGTKSERRWEIPIHPPIRNRRMAEKHAKYIMAGILSMEPLLGPKYTVV